MFPKIGKERSKIRLTPLETISIIYRSNGVDFLRQQNFAAEKSIFVVWKTVAKICNFFHTTNIDFSASAKFCKFFAILKTLPHSHIIHSRPPRTFTRFVIFVACTNSKILIFSTFFYLAGRLLFSTPTLISGNFAAFLKVWILQRTQKICIFYGKTRFLYGKLVSLRGKHVSFSFRGIHVSCRGKHVSYSEKYVSFTGEHVSFKGNPVSIGARTNSGRRNMFGRGPNHFWSRCVCFRFTKFVKTRFLERGDPCREK